MIMVSEEYSHKLKTSLFPENFLIYALREPGGNTITSYDAASILEKSLKFAIRNGYAGRVGNLNTHLGETTTNTLVDIGNEIDFAKGLITNDDNLQKHITDLEEIKKSLENYLEVFIG